MPLRRLRPAAALLRIVFVSLNEPIALQELIVSAPTPRSKVRIRFKLQIRHQIQRLATRIRDGWHVLEGTRVVNVKPLENLEEILIVSISVHLALKLKQELPDFLPIKCPARIGIGLLKRLLRGREQLHLRDYLCRAAGIRCSQKLAGSHVARNPSKHSRDGGELDPQEDREAERQARSPEL